MVGHMTRAGAGDANDRTMVERHDPLIGTVLDRRFRIDFQLAAGGFGAIYRATDVMSDAEVALKVLHPQLARDPMVVARFRREGKTLANLRDPHTITAYELGEAPDGTMYIVMELLHGESLYQRFRARGPMPWRQVLHIARGVCSSLAEAHAAGIVHRDLKPANIHLETRDGDPDFVKVLDFGIAKIVQGNDRDRTELTQAGTMIGTVDYMSPEQMVGGEMTPASDIYTLGVVIYEMIAGRTPFADAQAATAILAAVLTQTPDPLSRHATVPPTLDQIIARCLEREPNNRFLDITELGDALAAVASSGVARRNPAVPATGFEQPVLTNEATRINVRYSESSEPVLDARGPRGRPSEPPGATVIPPPHVAPVVGAHAASPALTPGTHARGSQHAIDARGWQPMPDRRGFLPLIGLAQPHPQAPLSQPHPHPQYHHQPPPTPPAMVGPLVTPLPVQGSTYRGYDLTGDATRDTMVRRIIWFSLLAAFAIAILILTRS
jgi:serine/threonine protein kinase